MKILILGVNGFMGKALFNKFSEKHMIIGFDKNIDEDFFGKSNFKFIKGDFQRLEIDEAINNVDVIIHLISTTIPNEDTSAIDKEVIENIIPTLNLLEAIRKADSPKRLIFASSGGTVYGESDIDNSVRDELRPISSYGMQKKIIEDYIQFYGRMYNLDYQILRISNPYGVGQNPKKPQGVIPIFINKIINDENIVIMGDGEQIRDYIYMDDLMDAFDKVLDTKKRKNILNIGSGVGYSLNEIIRVIKNILGIDSISITYTQERCCDVKNSVLNIDDTKRIINWIPVNSLEEGIKKLIKLN